MTNIFQKFQIEIYSGTYKRAEDGLDKINEDMKEAEKNLNQMDKICGIFTCPCGRNNAVVEPSKVFGKVLFEKYLFLNNYSDEKRPVEKNSPTAVQKTELGQMKRLADDEREDEMDENLDQVFQRPFFIFEIS